MLMEGPSGARLEEQEHVVYELLLAENVLRLRWWPSTTSRETTVQPMSSSGSRSQHHSTTNPKLPLRSRISSYRLQAPRTLPPATKPRPRQAQGSLPTASQNLASHDLRLLEHQLCLPRPGSWLAGSRFRARSSLPSPRSQYHQRPSPHLGLSAAWLL